MGGASGFAVDLLYFMCGSTFGLYGSLHHFILAWIILFDPPLCMGMAMLRAAQKYIGAYLGIVHKSVHKLPWQISQCGHD